MSADVHLPTTGCASKVLPFAPQCRPEAAHYVHKPQNAVHHSVNGAVIVEMTPTARMGCTVDVSESSSHEFNKWAACAALRETYQGQQPAVCILHVLP